LPDAPADPFAPFDLTGQPAIVAAVSGGSDSTALLLLLKKHLDRIGHGDRLTVVTVDHALRPSSASEARTVAELCNRLGVRHRIVTWVGSKPETGIAAAARAARYRLLGEAAAGLGSSVVLTGHTADDQAETVGMRQVRGGDRGLAGMAPATLFQERLWILRPLLGLARQDLRDLLRAEAIDWFDDPTNTNPAHERARLRATLRPDEASALLVRAALAAERRTAAGAEAAALIQASASRVAPGLIRLAPDFAERAGAPTASYAMRILLAGVGGMSHLPDEARVSALVTSLGRARFRATLSRSVVEVRRDGIYLRRENRSLPEPYEATNGDIWDGRFRIEAGAGAGKAIVMPDPGGGEEVSAAETATPARLIAAAGRTMPRLFAAESDSHIAPFWTARPILPHWRDFLPGFDLAPARVLAGLLGANEPASPPLRQHNVTPA
jgi:tRNA(Ile)-lysidine synthase